MAGYITIDLEESGLGNRICKWKVIYYIAYLNGLTIKVNWPELDEIELPNTEKGKLKDVKKFKTYNIKPDFELDSSFNWKAVCGWEFTRRINEKENPFTKAKIKNTHLQKALEENILNKKIAGIHIRKGDYVKTDKFKPKCPFRIPNWWYINMAKQILEVDPDIKFVIASDGKNE